jgi:hypothetical protein
MTDQERITNEKLQRELEQLQAILTDPAAVWASMLAGTIARPRALEHYEECKTALELSERQNAAMREALKAIREHYRYCHLCETSWWEPHNPDCVVGKTITHAAVRNYIPREDVEPLLSALEYVAQKGILSAAEAHNDFTRKHPQTEK